MGWFWWFFNFSAFFHLWTCIFKYSWIKLFQTNHVQKNFYFFYSLSRIKYQEYQRKSKNLKFLSCLKEYLLLILSCIGLQSFSECSDLPVRSPVEPEQNSPKYRSSLKTGRSKARIYLSGASQVAFIKTFFILSSISYCSLFFTLICYMYIFLINQNLIEFGFLTFALNFLFSISNS